MTVNHSDAVLLVVDVQVGIDDLSAMERNNPKAEKNVARLIKAWRDAGREVIHIKHNSTESQSPLRPESPGNQFKPESLPADDEIVFEKTVNSAFIGTELESYLRKNSVNNLVIVGLTTDHCVSTTTRMAGNLGFDVLLVEDATATFGRHDKQGKEISAQQIHEINLLSLDSEFCRVVSTNELL